MLYSKTCCLSIPYIPVCICQYQTPNSSLSLPLGNHQSILKESTLGDFPGGPVVKTVCAPKAGGPGLMPGQGTRSHMLQRKIRHTTSKTQRRQK